MIYTRCAHYLTLNEGTSEILNPNSVSTTEWN